jgi:alpha-methylacyl-CoA racemase
VNTKTPSGGPLTGVRVLEFVSIGPGPHCGMLLSDLGAEVVRIDREGGNGWANPIVDRGRHSLILDIRQPEGQRACRAIAKKADVVLEGLRPGVMERMGLGPEILCADNPRLIYARMTGWGQTGPRAHTAGHDINYIGLTGALAAMGKPEEPAMPPLNLVGDLGGGSLFATLGILAALFERESSGLGQVIDAAMVDGVASLMTMFAGLLPRGAISLDRARNVLAGAAPFYRCYRCADDREVAVGALEPRFYRALIERLGAPAAFFESQYDSSTWAERTTHLAQLFREKTREDWVAHFRGAEACLSAVLGVEESLDDPHLLARHTYVTADGLKQAAPAPRFSRTPGRIQSAGHGRTLLQHWGVVLPDPSFGAY